MIFTFDPEDRSAFEAANAWALAARRAEEGDAGPRSIILGLDGLHGPFSAPGRRRVLAIPGLRALFILLTHSPPLP